MTDLKLGLAEIGIFASYDELELFFARYDTDKDGRLRFSEFASAFTPLDFYAASKVNNRGSNNVRPYPARDSSFEAATRFDFKNLWRTHFKVENAAEYLRKRLRNIPLFSVYESFKTCDINQDGIVTKSELRRLFDQRGLYVSDRDADILMEKFDKDRDGRISYSEFMDEILPKSPVK